MLVYVTYPEEFLCYAKFKRHLDRLLKPEDIIIYKEDPQSMIGRYLNEEDRYSVVLSDTHVELYKYFTQAILFEDQNAVFSALPRMEEADIRVHYIPLALTKVVNKYKASYDVYIGRGSEWGNPVAITEDVSREDAIEAYETSFYDAIEAGREDVLAALETIKGKTLGCFCKPQACHGDVLADYLNGLDDGL